MNGMIPETYLHVYIGVLRYVAPFLVALLLLRCFRPLLTFRKEPEIWAWLMMEDGKKSPSPIGRISLAVIRKVMWLLIFQQFPDTTVF